MTLFTPTQIRQVSVENTIADLKKKKKKKRRLVRW